MKKTLLRTIIAIIVVLSTFLYAACAKNEGVKEVNEIGRGNFAQRVDADDLSFDVIPIDSTIAKGADQLAAVIYLMGIAESNYFNADYLAKVSLGGGSAIAAGLTGKMTVRSLSIREGDTSYSQSIGRVYEGDPQGLLGAAQMLLDQGKRTYTINCGDEDEEVSYRQEPKNKGNPAMTDTFPFATCNFAAADLETIDKEHPDEENDFHLKYNGELTNFVISTDSILPESYSVVFDDEKGCYTVIFEIDVRTQDSRNAYTDRPRASLRKSATSSDLEFKKYKVTMEMWDNGLIKTYSTEEEWEATLELTSFIKPNGASESKSTDYYSYDEDDCEIEDYVEEGFISLDWIPNN